MAEAINIENAEFELGAKLENDELCTAGVEYAVLDYNGAQSLK